MDDYSPPSVGGYKTKKGDDSSGTDENPGGLPSINKYRKKETAPAPTVGEYALDAAKAGPVGVAQGTIAIPGMLGDLEQLGRAAHEKLDQKLPEAPGWLKTANDFLHNPPGTQFAPKGNEQVFPTSADLQHKVENYTGPFYEAKYGPGKAVQTGGQILPSIAMGGSIPGAVAKAVAGGVTSELAGEGANAIKGHLPNVLQPWAEPVARAFGTIPGMAAPSLARRAVTPLPMTNARLADVNSLKAVNPELVNSSTAGQLTESPRIAGLEARSPRMADLPARQEEAYTRGVMRQAGADGQLFDAAGKALAAGRGNDIRMLQNSHNMNSTEFADLNRDLKLAGAPGSELYRAVGPSQPYADFINQIKNGPLGGKTYTPLSMTGERYGAMKQIAQNAGEAAPTTHESTAIFNARDRMKQAFHSSMPPDEAAHLQDLDRQYHNFKTIENIPTKAGESTLTPNKVVNRGSRELESHANLSAPFMKPLPKPNTEGGAGTKILGGLLGGLGGIGGGLMAHSAPEAVGAGLFGSYYGLNHLNDAVQAAKNGAGRVVANPIVQGYLKNQQWRPGGNSTLDKETLLRLLMTPPAKQVAGPQSQ